MHLRNIIIHFICFTGFSICYSLLVAQSGDKLSVEEQRDKINQFLIVVDSNEYSPTLIDFEEYFGSGNELEIAVFLEGCRNEGYSQKECISEQQWKYSNKEKENSLVFEQLRNSRHLIGANTFDFSLKQTVGESIGDVNKYCIKFLDERGEKVELIFLMNAFVQDGNYIIDIQNQKGESIIYNF